MASAYLGAVRALLLKGFRCVQVADGTVPRLTAPLLFPEAVCASRGHLMKRTPVLLGLIGALTLAACTQTSAPKAAPQTYVLVHGALLGEFSWTRVERQLVADGNTVITLDLPGHGADQTPAAGLTLNTYRDAVIQAIGERSNVVLVGHSFGGMVVSQVAEAIPSKISKLVYVAALIPQTGESANTLTKLDSGSQFGKYVTPGTNTLVFSPDGVQPVFCNDCSAEDVAMLKAKLRPEPSDPFGDTVTLSAERYGSVAKYDVLTKRDNAVSYPFQQTLLARGKFVKSMELDTSHVPFFSQPQLLAKTLEGF
jgi:pimeloyl-ACP methyl ester carboxylesterase